MKYKYTYRDAYDVAKERCGKLLYFDDLDVGVSSLKKLEWECKVGHRFTQQLCKTVVEGNWCPVCSSGLYERIVKAHFEQIFCNKFIKTRPKWIVGIKGRPLELDGYCEELNLAFEHNGAQHYRLINHGYFKLINFNNIKKNDLIKKQRCMEKGVKLIIVPQLVTDVKVKDLKNFIINECIKQDVVIPKGWENLNIDLSKAYSWSDVDKLNEIKKIAKSKKIICLSDYYLGVANKLNFKCEVCDNEWDGNISDIKKEVYGCPKCAIKRNNDAKRFSKQFVEEFINNKGGKLLSDYVGARDKIKLQCNKCDNVWECSFDNIRRGYWCANCAKCKRLTIEFIKEFAKSKGWVCLSDQYVNAHSDLLWKCDKGHEWIGTYCNVKTKRICPECRKEML